MGANQTFLPIVQESPPAVCAVVDIAHNLMLSDKYQLDSLKIFKSDFKNYAVRKMACKSLNSNCYKEETCNNIIYMNVSCSLCIFELDSAKNPCIFTLDANTTYANALN